MKRLCAALLLSAVLTACGKDGAFTSPEQGVVPVGWLAIGTDPVTGATIETNRDDYLPGEVVHLVGSNWAPGETIHLVMTESPDTHADVVQDVTADSAGAFALHFYDVQPHDFGVTFTLTGTGSVSGSSATVVFTDGRIVSSVTMNGNAPPFSVTVTPPQVLTFVIGGSTVTGGGNARWLSTRVDFVPHPTGVATSFCDETNVQPANTPTTGLSVTVVAPAPTDAGSYRVQVTAFQDDGCVTQPSTPFPGTGDQLLVTVNGAVVNTPPTLAPIGDRSVNEGSQLTFTATATDSDTPAQTLTFSLIGAPAGAAITPAGAFTWTPTDGPTQTATFSVRVTDNGSPNKFAEEAITVTVDNVAPTATFTAPASASSGASFSISLTSPSDVSTDDVAAGFTYAFDCGSGYGAFGGATSATCTAGPPGSQTVKGKIRDKDLSETEYTASLAINNVPPTSVPGGPYSGNEASPITISGSGTDPDGGPVTFEWSVSPATPACAFSPTPPTGASATITCNDDGTFTLTLKVTDDEGAVTPNVAVLTVANVAPTIGTHTLGTTVNEGSTIPFSVASVTDPSPVDQAAGFEYAFACDGATYGAFSSSNMANCPAGDGPGSVTIAGKARDKDGGVSTEVSSVFTVTNVAPTATFANDGPVDEASSFTLSLINPQDPSAADVAAGFQYAFDCGSGYGGFSGTSTATCPTDDSGPVSVKGKIKDKDGGFTEYPGTVTVNNVAPTATFVASSPVDEGTSFSLALNGATDVSPVDALTLTFAFDCGSGSYGAAGSSSTATCPTTDNGTRDVRGKVIDKDGGFTEYEAQVTINNVAPTVTGVTAPTSVAEGTDITFSASGVTDPSTADVTEGFTFAYSCDGGATYGAFGASPSGTCAAADGPATITVGVKARDKDGGESAGVTRTVSVTNVDPQILGITVPPSPIAAGTMVTVSWNFTDPGSDTWTCQIAWDTPGAFDPAFGSSGQNCSATKALSAGVYTVTVKVTDDDGGYGTMTATSYIVVYDPTAGFVTGGGWINSPSGAYAPDPTLTGKANFGFVAKYKKGQTLPDGNTEFQFHAGNVNFKSTSYEWLVVAGKRAQYKGEGTVNGTGAYGFMLSAIDGQLPGGGGIDKFRIKIWDKSTSIVVYDNQMGQLEDSDAATALGGGSVVIHSK